MKFLILLALLPFTLSLDNGLGLTPPMGWNSWNKFYCGINETLIQEIADAFVTTGLADAGYNYVNLDDCWQTSRDPDTDVIIADPQAFPSGIKALADYVHDKGLKFGLYSDAGEFTCQGRPGGLYYEDLDAATYASWGVDYLKYDNCNNLNLPAQFRYPRMRDALNQTGRPIYYSICEWGAEQSWEWAAPVGNSWRTTMDIRDGWESVLSILDQQVNISSFGGVGGWNDPDMLEVGNGGMSYDEYQSHFALWAYLKSPLIIGCDVRTMDNDTLTILTNKELIAINQDPLGKPAVRYSYNGAQEVWGASLSDGFAVLLFNRDGQNAEMAVDLTQLNLSGSYTGRDLINHVDINGAFTTLYAQVGPHGVYCVKLTPVEEIESDTETDVETDDSEIDAHSDISSQEEAGFLLVDP